MRRFVREVEDVTPNLIPIMNLFTALIPFLLMSAVFYQVSVIQISVPVASSDGETDVAKKEDTITLTMQILPTRYILTASSDTLEPKLLKKLSSNLDRGNLSEEQIRQELAKLAKHIKGKYSASNTAIVVPDPAIPYERVVSAIDGIRQGRIEHDGQETVISLFPLVVLSSKVN